MAAAWLTIRETSSAGAIESPPLRLREGTRPGHNRQLNLSKFRHILQLLHLRREIHQLRRSGRIALRHTQAGGAFILRRMAIVDCAGV
jgi:hypothetical protein